jgi:hypothetical protein
VSASAAARSLLAALAWALMQPLTGAAQDAVELDVPDCHEVRGDEVRALVALELAPRLRVAGPGEPAQLVARLRCTTGSVAALSVEDPARPTPLQLELDLATSAPAARTRLLALSIAELIATSRLERQEPSAPQPAPAPAPPTLPEPAQDAGDDAPTRLRLWLGPGLSFTGEPATALFGASAGVSYAFGWFALQSELQARFGKNELPDADVAVRTFSASLALAPLLTRGALELSAGAGARVGYAGLTGESRRPEVHDGSVAGVFFGPLALCALDVDLGLPGRLRLALEAGYATHGVVGQDEQDQTLLSLRGPWFSALAGLALAP